MKKLIIVLIMGILTGCQGSPECQSALNIWEGQALAGLNTGSSTEGNVSALFGIPLEEQVNEFDTRHYRWVYLVRDLGGNVCEARYVSFIDGRYQGFSFTTAGSGY